MRPLTDTLRDLRGGDFADEATEALATLVNAVMATGKAGTLTIELKLTRASRGSGALVVADKLSVKTPTERASETMMFGTVEGSLVSTDPRQSKLDLKVAPKPDDTVPLKVPSQESVNG